MDQEKVIVIDFGGQYTSWLRAVSVNVMYIVRFILTRQTWRRLRP